MQSIPDVGPAASIAGHRAGDGAFLGPALCRAGSRRFSIISPRGASIGSTSNRTRIHRVRSAPRVGGPMSQVARWAAVRPLLGRAVAGGGDPPRRGGDALRCRGAMASRRGADAQRFRGAIQPSLTGLLPQVSRGVDGPGLAGATHPWPWMGRCRWSRWVDGQPRRGRWTTVSRDDGHIVVRAMDHALSRGRRTPRPDRAVAGGLVGSVVHVVVRSIDHGVAGAAHPSP